MSFALHNTGRLDCVSDRLASKRVQWAISLADSVAARRLYSIKTIINDPYYAPGEFLRDQRLSERQKKKERSKATKPRCREPFRIRGERQAGRGSIVQRVDSRSLSTRFPYRANENFTIGSNSRVPVSVWSMHAAQANYLLFTRSVESRSFNGSDRRRDGKTTTTTTIVSILSFDSSIDRRIGW